MRNRIQSCHVPAPFWIETYSFQYAHVQLLQAKEENAMKHWLCSHQCFAVIFNGIFSFPVPVLLLLPIYLICVVFQYERLFSEVIHHNSKC